MTVVIKGKYSTRDARLPNGAKWVVERDGHTGREDYIYLDLARKPVVKVWREKAWIVGKRRASEPVKNPDTGKQTKRVPQHWFDGADGKRPKFATNIPYRLPELAEAIDQKKTIYIAEGEPKVELLRSWGLFATCNIGGAENWTLHDAWHLRYAADVVIVPDNDDAGRGWSDAVGRTLAQVRQGVARLDVQRVRLMELPGLVEHGDVVDWTAAGGTKEKFSDLVAAAPDWRPRGPEKKEIVIHTYGEEPPAPLRWLVRNVLPEAGAGLMSGQWGTLKSALLTDLCGATIKGGFWLGEPVRRRGGILYIAVEGEDLVYWRARAMFTETLRMEPDLFCAKQPFKWITSCPRLVDKNALATLTEVAAQAQEDLREHHGVDLVLIVVDTLARSAGWKDENDTAQGVAVMNTLAALSKATGAFVIAADHFGKDASAGTRGTSSKEDAADVVIALTKNGDSYLLTLRKVRAAAGGREVPFTSRVVHMGEDENGDPITAPVIVWAVPPRARAPRKTKTELILERALSRAIREHGEAVENGGGQVVAVQKEHLRAAFTEAYLEARPNSTGHAIAAALSRALKDEDGVAATDGARVWLREDAAGPTTHPEAEPF